MNVPILSLATSIRKVTTIATLASGLVFAPFAAQIATAATASSASTNKVFVALGDSIAAGYSASPDLASSPNAAPCARSNVNYPDLAASSLGMQEYNLACSGATVPAGVTGPQTVQYGNPVQTATIPAQITQAQNIAAAGHGIKLATLTVSANDLTWSAWLSQCVNPTTNCATDANTATFNAQLAITNSNLLQVLQQLRDMGVEHVELTGYYDPMGALAGSPQGYPLTQSEVTWYRQRLNSVNTLLASDAKQFSHTSYLPFDTVLNAAAGDVIPLTQPGGGHPTAQGQRKLAAALVADRE